MKAVGPSSRATQGLIEPYFPGTGPPKLRYFSSAARDLLARIEGRMSADNAFIIRRVCGEGAWPSEAVRERYAG